MSEPTSSRNLNRGSVGVIGTEPVGGAVASRLAATGRRVIYLPLPPSAKPERTPYLEVAATLADVGLECDVIVMAIDDTAVLRKVLLGDADRPGLALDLKPGGTLIDFGVRPPREVQSVQGLVGMRGVGVVDAALLGGCDAIANGRANVLVGGFPDAVDNVLPVLAELGTLERTGPLGSAQTAAALMGYVEAAHIAARSEAMSVGANLGLHRQALAHIFNEPPEPDNVVRLTRRAEVGRRIIEEGTLTGDVIAFRRLAVPASPGESG